MSDREKVIEQAAEYGGVKFANFVSSLLDLLEQDIQSRERRAQVKTLDECIANLPKVDVQDWPDAAVQTVTAIRKKLVDHRAALSSKEKG